MWKKLTQKIDRILHGEDQLELGEYQEGDLEILKDEIYKMTVRLREQNEHLKKEKTFLADALANISHQIRTPLTSVNLMLERIRKQDLEERQKRKIYREMAEMLQRMEWLILGLLKISKLDAGAVVLDKQRIQVEPFIREVVRSLEIPMELREQKLILKGTSDAAFYGDASWTMEAVGNVLKNCMEHTPIGGTIRIAWEENPLYTELSVTDSGNGIDRKSICRISLVTVLVRAEYRNSSKFWHWSFASTRSIPYPRKGHYHRQKINKGGGASISCFVFSRGKKKKVGKVN